MTCVTTMFQGKQSGRLARITRMEFGEFYQDSRDSCLSAVAMVVHDRMLAEDLVAEGFARAFARWPKLGKHPDPRAWVVRTALNVNISRWRRRRNEVHSPDSRAFNVDAAVVAAPPLDEAVAAAVASLPLRQRQVIALRIFLDLDTAASAAVLGIACGTVTAHLHRAVTTLSTVLGSNQEMELKN